MGLDKRDKDTVKKCNLCCLENVTNVQTSVLKYFANSTIKKNNKQNTKQINYMSTVMVICNKTNNIIQT